MGLRYTVSRPGTALSPSADLATIIVPATCAGKVWVLSMQAQGIASVANEIVFARSSGGVTSSALLTPGPQGGLGSASAITVATAWGTQPTLGQVMRRFSVNGNGGGFNAPLPFGVEIDLAPNSTFSIRSVLGVSVVTLDLVFEQIG